MKYKKQLRTYSQIVTHDSISDLFSLLLGTGVEDCSSFFIGVQSGNNSCEHVTCVDTLHS